jgi:hypothetical protein
MKTQLVMRRAGRCRITWLQKAWQKRAKRFWFLVLKRVVARSIEAFAYPNNQYAGHAPATVKLLWETWNKR